jgi:hypothetical protein
MLSVMYLCFSLALLVACVVLFQYERERERRILERQRKFLDFYVLKMNHAIHVCGHYLGRDVFRQIFHYLFHRLLSMLLSGMKRIEERLMHTIRANKLIAKTVERDSTVRNKLEEIALHKIEVALSEKEKAHHRNKALMG